MKLKLALLAVFLPVVLLGFRGPADAEPVLLTDAELDEVTAAGVEFKLKVSPEGDGVDFEFDLGQVLGNGSVFASPAALPSNFTFNGNTNLSQSQFYVENMIFNLNLCVQCRANEIIQLGIGAGVTVQPTVGP